MCVCKLLLLFWFVLFFYSCFKIVSLPSTFACKCYFALRCIALRDAASQVFLRAKMRLGLKNIFIFLTVLHTHAHGKARPRDNPDIRFQFAIFKK